MAREIATMTVKLTYSDGTIEHLALANPQRFVAKWQKSVGKTFRLFSADFSKQRFAKLVSVELN
jgi:hypothetical protein